MPRKSPVQFGSTSRYLPVLAGGRYFAPPGRTAAGFHAMESLRLEKAYRSRGRDICAPDTVVESGLTFAVALDEGGDFIGRDSVLQERDERVARRLAVFTFGDPKLLLGNEPIWRDGQLVGRTKWWTFGHTLGVSVGMGYVEGPNGMTPGRVRIGTCELELAEERFPAKVRLTAPYDPRGRRVRMLPALEGRCQACHRKVIAGDPAGTSVREKEMPKYGIASELHMSDDTGDINGDPIEALRSVAASGFTEVELIAEGVGWEDGPPDSAPFRKALASTGLNPHTIHAPFIHINLASFDERERKDSVARVAAAMRFHAEIGGRTVIVHPTGGADSPDEPLYTWENVGPATEQAHRSISELVRVGEETGVRLALENLFAKTECEARPLVTMRELRSFMADLPAEYVGICHDTGHTRLQKLDVATETRIASDRLIALHISDGFSDEDDHLPPGHGVIDFDSFGQALDDIGFDGAWTLEVLATNHPGTVEDVAIELAAIRDRWLAEGIRNVR